MALGARRDSIKALVYESKKKGGSQIPIRILAKIEPESMAFNSGAWRYTRRGRAWSLRKVEDVSNRIDACRDARPAELDRIL